VPTRLRFKELPPELVPRSEALSRAPMDPALAIDADFLSSVVERWRGAMLSNRVRGEDSSLEFDSLASEEFSSVRQAAPRAPERPVPPPGNGFARPDSFFFPVESNAGGPGPRQRK